MTEESNETKYILAIDHGTSGMKIAITDTCGEVIAFDFEGTPVYLSEGGGAEQDPDEWWSALVKCTRRLVDANHVPVEDIVAISNSSQWLSEIFRNFLKVIMKYMTFDNLVHLDRTHMSNVCLWLMKRA